MLHRSLVAVQERFDQGEREVPALIEAGKQSFRSRSRRCGSTTSRSWIPRLSIRLSDLSRGALVAVAAFVGKARLIDNIVLADGRTTEGRVPHPPGRAKPGSVISAKLASDCTAL